MYFYIYRPYISRRVYIPGQDLGLYIQEICEHTHTSIYI